MKLNTLFAASASLVAITPAFAATITKDVAGTDLTAGASWVGATPPGSSDIATWSGTSLGAGLTMASAQSWQGIDVQGAAGAIAISGAGVLTLGASGINIAAAGQDLTFTNSVTFSGTTSDVAVGTARTLYLNGVKSFSTGTVTTLNGTGTVEIGASQNSTGAGDVVLSSGTLFMNMQGGTHNRTGSTTINGGIVKTQTSLNFFGSGTVNLNGGAIGSGNGTRRIWNNSFIVGGDFGVGGTGLSTGAIQLTGNVDFGGASRQVTVASILELNGTGGNGTLVKQGAGSLVLGVANYSTLNVSLAAGSMMVSGNGTSQIGSLSGVTGTTIASNYNLSTDGLRTLSVNQTGDGVFAGVINNAGTATRAISLVKNGAAKLTLSGTNTYAGTTTINAGTLITGNTAALGAGSVTLAGGTLQIGNGTVQTVALGSAKNITATAAATLAFNGATSAITLSGGGKYDFTGQTITLDLNNAFNAASSYNLITGGTGNVDAAGYVFSNFDTTNFSASFANGTLIVTAIPEPSTYGLLGAGALAGLAAVRRRRTAAAARA